MLHGNLVACCRDSKRAVRAEKRQRTALLAVEAEQARDHPDTRKCYAILRRFVPKVSAPMVAVLNPTTNLVCFDAVEEMQVRADALQDIFQAELIEMSSPGGPTDVVTVDV